MSDRIELRGLRVTAICGVLPEEKARRQPFEVDMEVHADLSTASISDDLSDTVDYGSLTGLVADIVDGESFDLLERFAGLRDATGGRPGPGPVPQLCSASRDTA